MTRKIKSKKKQRNFSNNEEENQLKPVRKKEKMKYKIQRWVDDEDDDYGYDDLYST